MTFTVMLLLFIPIGIIVDVSEKINRMLENKVPFEKVGAVSLHGFIVYFANFALRNIYSISIIWFTFKLARILKSLLFELREFLSEDF